MSEYIIRPPEHVDSSLSLRPIIVGETLRDWIQVHDAGGESQGQGGAR